MFFRNRAHAGKLLARRLRLAEIRNPLVIALPRGGVPIGYELARELHVPLEVLVVRKIGAPSHPEFGIGAITENGYYWVNDEFARATGTSRPEIEKVLHREHGEVARRVKEYRDGRPFPSVRGKNVIVVDDGLATGVTAKVASHYLKAQGAQRVILAIPVCAPDASRFLRSEVDEVICLEEPEIFRSVGQFYEDFNQTTDEEVISLLSRARGEPGGEAPVNSELSAAQPIRQEVMIQEHDAELRGSLAIPPDAKGFVIFAHGSGSSRFSPRNGQVAKKLNDAGFGTLLFDLLTEEESLDRKNIFDIPLLASRLVLATDWLKNQSATKDLPIGYFGASTGAGAALWAASQMGREISAVVSRGGRPDLAIARLPKVTAPALLLVGENDEPVIKMNQEAMKYLATSNLIVVPGATHLFEEPDALETVSDEAVNWFSRYFRKSIRHAAA